MGALVACLAVVLAGTGSAETAQARPLATGISYVLSSEPAAFEQAEATGATLVQAPVYWAQIAPRQEPAAWQPRDPADPHYNWGPIDLWVRNAVAQGLTPLLQIRSAPLWAQRCPFVTTTEPPCRPDPAELADFASAAAQRYSGWFEGLPRVRFWQGLDEPNLSLYFEPQFEGGRAVSAALYRELINGFYRGVKSVVPGDIVLAAGLGPIARPRFTIGPMRFTRELLCMAGRSKPHPTRGSCEGGVHFDVFDIHPYTTGGPTHKGHVDDVELGDLTELGDLLAAADQAHRIKGRYRRTPLWITEMSWDSKPPDPGGVPMRILKRWTAEALFRSWQAGVTHFFWFTLRDQPPNPKLPASQTLQSGLYFRGATVAEDRPKPNLRAFRFPFVAYASRTGFTYWGRTPSSEAGRVRVQVREGGRWRNAAIARATRQGIFEGAVLTRYGRSRHGSVRALYRREESVPFSLHPVRDFHQAPFGNPVPGE